MWHLVADRLAEQFTLVMADLRGYGDSGKPQTDAEHSPYSKRAMAADMAQLMTALGHQTFAVMGHDRGGRVAHRLARDYAERVTRLAVLDIAPTANMYQTTDMKFANAYYHWFFLIQPYPLPETLIGADPEFYLRQKIGSWGKSGDVHTDEAMADYLRCFSNPATIHASCEDYRAAASIDLIHDEADKGRKLDIPLFAISGAASFVSARYDLAAEWQTSFTDVYAAQVPGGHFLAEESPDELLELVIPFFAQTE
tara:strand:- start:27 stop:788 length:762 start_codon:yes stop_codon:yes gene_type:complete